MDLDAQPELTEPDNPERHCPGCGRLLVVMQKLMVKRTKDHRIFWTEVYLHDCPGPFASGGMA